MFDWLNETPLWEYLKQTDKPIVMYGMGDGALKIMRVLERFEIPLAGFFASDEFVRGHTFCDFPVRTLKQTEELFGEFIILLAFGTQRPELLETLTKLASTHELYAPDVPVCVDDTTLFDRAYLEQHGQALKQVYDRLADEQSKHTFLSILRYKLSGKVSYLIDCETPVSEAFEQILVLDNEEDYVDLGAYNGDTVARFLDMVDDYHSIQAWEPDAKNYKKLCKNTAHLERMEALHLGAYEREETLYFAAKAGRQSTLSTNATTTHQIATAVSSVDVMKQGRRVSYLKFDVEGAEEQALKGCRQTIRTYRPKLELSAYHRNSDLWSLPQILDEICPDYQLYLRHHPYFPAWDTIFYCR